MDSISALSIIRSALAVVRSKKGSFVGLEERLESLIKWYELELDYPEVTDKLPGPKKVHRLLRSREKDGVMYRPSLQAFKYRWHGRIPLSLWEMRRMAILLKLTPAEEYRWYLLLADRREGYVKRNGHLERWERDLERKNHNLAAPGDG